MKRQAVDKKRHTNFKPDYSGQLDRDAGDSPTSSAWSSTRRTKNSPGRRPWLMQLRINATRVSAKPSLVEPAKATHSPAWSTSIAESSRSNAPQLSEALADGGPLRRRIRAAGWCRFRFRWSLATLGMERCREYLRCRTRLNSNPVDRIDGNHPARQCPTEFTMFWASTSS